MTNSVKTRHTALQTIVLHLVPGLINFFVIILLTPLAELIGFGDSSRSFAGQLMVIVSICTVQIGFLIYTARKSGEAGGGNLLSPMLNKAKLPEYIIFCAIMTAWALGISTLLTPFEHSIRDGLFSFVSDSFAMRNTAYNATPKHLLVFLGFFTILTNGFIAPISEELYFRGYLLPRINMPLLPAVIVNALLFSLYHFFSPWYFFSRVLMMVPLYYWVLRRKNIRFSIIAHVIANMFTSISVLFEIMSI